MMQCTKLLALRKAILPLTSLSLFKTECQCANMSGVYLVRRRLHESVTNETSITKPSMAQKVETEGFWSKLFCKLGIYDRKTIKMMYLGYLVYENIVDKINYSNFYEDFNMTDTFYSWFLVTELHIWMAMLRYMAEGKDGKTVKLHIVEAMWKDVDIRIDHMGRIAPSVKRKQVQDLSDQFIAAIVGYDEGIMSDDKVLASALWRSFFHLECNNPELLEKLLIYIRKQVHMMDEVPSEEVLSNPTFKWLDLRSIK